MAREAEVTLSDPFVMGVDVARFGDDRTVIALRRGRDARSIPWIKLAGADTMTVAAKVAEIAQQYRPDAIFIDGGGPGGGVVDRLRQLQHSVFDVQFGGKADHSHIGQDGAIVYANKRAEMWGSMRAWLAGGMIPDDRELLADLTGVEYGYALREGRDAIILEKKEDMKKRGLASPDLADALALTFAYPVAATTIAGSSPENLVTNISMTRFSRPGPDGCEGAGVWIAEKGFARDEHPTTYAPSFRLGGNLRSDSSLSLRLRLLPVNSCMMSRNILRCFFRPSSIAFSISFFLWSRIAVMVSMATSSLARTLLP